MNNWLAAVLIGLFLLAFLRFDYALILLPYRVQPGDTLWGILSQEVVKNTKLTALIIKHLQVSHPLIDWNHLESNSLDGSGGYTVSIWFNKLTLEAANGGQIVSSVPLLPPAALNNHFLMVLVHNIVSIAIACYAFITLKANRFLVDRRFFKELIIDPALLGFLVVIPAGLALMVVILVLSLS